MSTNQPVCTTTSTSTSYFLCSPSPRPRAPLHPPLNLPRHPSAIKVPFLRPHLLPIHKALPRRVRVEAQVPLDILEPLARVLVTPHLVRDYFSRLGRVCEAMVRRFSFPFAVGRVRGRGGEERAHEGGGREVVGCWGEDEKWIGGKRV